MNLNGMNLSVFVSLCGKLSDNRVSEVFVALVNAENSRLSENCVFDCGLDQSRNGKITIFRKFAFLCACRIRDD